MQDLPSLTVLICCYSGERFFEETFESVVRQTGLNFKIIVHDNGCSESYRRKIKRAAGRSRAEIIRSEVNRYGEGVRFDVLPHIKTDYIATLHDDDLIEPGRLLADMQAIARHDYDYVFSDRRYIDENGTYFTPNAEEINTASFEPGDFPYMFAAETFSRGLRFHYSTFVIRTPVAQTLVFGDPYLPRIADCLFAVKLLLNRTLRGASLAHQGTAIRVHGSNDMLYAKFEPARRNAEVYLLTQSELFIFDWIIREAELDQLSAIFALFPGVEPHPGEDRPTLLVRAALKLQHWGRSKKIMAAHCVHEAFRLAPTRTVMAFRKLTDSDANAFMMALYGAYAREEIAEAGALADHIHPDTVELARIKSSLPWKAVKTFKLERFLPLLTARRASESAPFYQLGSRIMLSSPEANAYIVEGMGHPEPWGRWTDGFVASFRMTCKLDTDATLELLPIMVFEPTMNGHTITITANGQRLMSCSPAPHIPILVPLSKRLLRRSNVLQIDIHVPHPKTPDMEPVQDLRALGVGFESLTITALR